MQYLIYIFLVDLEHLGASFLFGDIHVLQFIHLAPYISP